MPRLTERDLKETIPIGRAGLHLKRASHAQTLSHTLVLCKLSLDSAPRINAKSCAASHAAANELPARRAASATLSLGERSSTVHTSARHVGPIRTRFL